MKKDMLGAVVRKLVEIPLEMLGAIYDFLEKLLGSEGQEWLAEFKKFLRKEKCWTGIISETILELIGTVTIPATIKRVVVRDYVEGARKTRKLYTGIYTGSNFENWFFEKTIEPIPRTELKYHKLRRGSVDDPIINELGGEAKAETALAEMFALIEMQANGEGRTLLTNNYANIFYIRDINGVLRAVFCYWRVGGWSVIAYSVESPGGCHGGNQVFSRNS